MGRIRLPKHIVLAGTLLGAAIGLICSVPSTNSEMHRPYRLLLKDNAAVRPIRFAIWGAIIGLAVDLKLRGRPRAIPRRFSLKMLLLAVLACAILLWGIHSYLEMRDPWSELFFGKSGVDWF